jgi:hypothetical protein
MDFFKILGKYLPEYKTDNVLNERMEWFSAGTIYSGRTPPEEYIGLNKELAYIISGAKLVVSNAIETKLQKTYPGGEWQDTKESKECFAEVNEIFATSSRDKIINIPPRVCSRPLIHLGTYLTYAGNPAMIRVSSSESDHTSWLWSKEDFVSNGFGDENTYDKLISYLKRNTHKIYLEMKKIEEELLKYVDEKVDEQKERVIRNKETAEQNTKKLVKKMSKMPQTKEAFLDWVRKGGECVYGDYGSFTACDDAERSFNYFSKGWGVVRGRPVLVFASSSGYDSRGNSHYTISDLKKKYGAPGTDVIVYNEFDVLD